MKLLLMIVIAAGALVGGAAHSKGRHPDSCFRPPCPWEMSERVGAYVRRPYEDCDDFRRPRPLPRPGLCRWLV